MAFCLPGVGLLRLAKCLEGKQRVAAPAKYIYGFVIRTMFNAMSYYPVFLYAPFTVVCHRVSYQRWNLAAVDCRITLSQYNEEFASKTIIEQSLQAV